MFWGGGVTASTTVLKARQSGNTAQSPFAPAPIEEVTSAITDAKPDVVFAPHVETASGMILPDDYIRQVTKADFGYSPTEPYPGVGYVGKAYNMLELGNSESGLQGNGVDVGDLPAGFQLGPIPNGPWPHPIHLWSIAVTGGRTIEMWLHYPNPIVGACP